MQFFWLAEVNNDKEVEDILLYFSIHMYDTKLITSR